MCMLHVYKSLHSDTCSMFGKVNGNNKYAPEIKI